MLKVGITGGIGSGKSTVCRIFEQLAIPVYYADDAATQIFYRQEVQDKMISYFGNEVVGKDGKVDRKLLSKIVFSKTEKLEALNAIIHPAVAEDMHKWEQKHDHASYLLKEAAILFESGTNKGLDKVITVVAPIELRIDRVRKREGITRDEIMARIDVQWSDEEKVKRSDFVIVNDEKSMLIPQVLEIHQKLLLVSK